eukprot:TRINITY_DN9949_c0_g1_i1.p1 TRINITY_DN9949_c0_g1~~TRINITY_DN9949_c0_g1_i1.p1  ORF type:complete len:936 (-),score=131.55 TRINITY_DN9949_c0_g1_i1:377-3184(-)
MLSETSASYRAKYEAAAKAANQPITTEAGTYADAICLYARALRQLILTDGQNATYLTGGSAAAFKEITRVLDKTNFQGPGGKQEFGLSLTDRTQQGAGDRRGPMILQQLISGKRVDIQAFEYPYGLTDVVELGNKYSFKDDSGKTSSTVPPPLLTPWCGMSYDSSTYPRCEKCSEVHKGSIYMNQGCVCDKGWRRVSLATLDCTKCLAGQYSDETGLLSCSSCKAGYFSREGNTSCEACPINTYSEPINGSAVPPVGATKCVPCREGFVSEKGSSTCSACMSGSFRTASQTECLLCPKGTYQAEAGTACQPCDPGFTTASQGSQSAAKCSCPPGTLRTTTNVCVSCDPVSSNCPGGVDGDMKISSQEGYMLVINGHTSRLLSQASSSTTKGAIYEKLPFSYKCRSDKACPGKLIPSTCPEGHQGIACAECTKDFTSERGTCVKCDEGSEVRLLFFIPCSLFFCAVPFAVLHFLSRPATAHLGITAALGASLSLFIQFTQVTAALPDLGIAWPNGFLVIIAILSFLCFDTEFLQLGCIFGNPTPGLRIMNKAFGLFGLLSLVLLIWGITQLKPVHQRVYKKLQLPTLTNALGFLCNMAFVPISLTAFSIFNCYLHPTEGSSMKTMPQMICYESEWSEKVVPSAVLILMLVAAIYTSFLLLARNAPMMAQPTRINFLLARFRPEGYLWGAVLLSRNLTLAVCPILSRNVFLVALLMKLVALVYLCIVLRAWPWKMSVLNYVDCIMMACLVAIIDAGVSHSEGKTYPYVDPSEQEGLPWKLMGAMSVIPLATVILMITYVGFYLFYDFKRNWRGQKAAKVMGHLFALATDLKTVQSAMEQDCITAACNNNLGLLSVFDIERIYTVVHIVNTKILAIPKVEGGQEQSKARSSIAKVAAASVMVGDFQPLLKMCEEAAVAEEAKTTMTTRSEQSVIELEC